MDAYINLVNTQKNSRIMTILEQTHNYLQNLGAKVSLSKRQTADKKADVVAPDSV
jgi:alcohol dehydrogenase YqhD (iron-dependent ADH family)